MILERALLLFVTACGSTGATSSSPDGMAGPPADAGPLRCDSLTTQQRVAMRVTLPTSATTFAVDLDGDGTKDNQLGALVSFYSSQNVSLQDGVDAAVNAGRILFLAEESSEDAAFQSDPGCATARLLQAVSSPNPSFAGSGIFTVDSSVSPAAVGGAIIAGRFASADAPTVRMPASTLLPGLMVDRTNTAIPLVVAHMSVVNLSGAATTLEVHGAIRAADFPQFVFAPMAAQLTSTIQADPSSSQAQDIEATYDTGDGNGGACTNTDGSTAAPNDQLIGECEVENNPLTQALYAPDVTLFDDTGAYHPDPTNGRKDSFSVGFRLSLVGATF